MFTYLALGLVLLGLVVGGPRALGRLMGGNWRPGVGMLALVCLAGAGVLAVMERFPPAAGLGLMGVMFALATRRTLPPRHVPPPAPSMDVARAASILGVAPDASEAEVQAAYRRLIVRAHPDQGGTEGLAAELNAARETLLRR